MSKIGNIRPKDLLRALEKKDFVRVKTVGSHIDLRHSKGYRTTVPMHSKSLGKGLVAKILKQAHLSVDELRALMR